MNSKFLSISASALVLLAGCGGGGGGGSTPNAGASTAGTGSATGPTSGSINAGTGSGTGSIQVTSATGPSVPIEQAIANLYTTGKTFNRVNAIGADTYVVMATYVNTGGSTFEGVPVTSESIKRIVTKNGAPFYSSDQTDYFWISPSFRIDGRVIPGAAASYFVSSPTEYTKLPVSGKPGDSAAFYNSTIYESSAKAVTIGTSAHTWNITADSDTTVRFCIHSVITIGTNATSQDDCYKINTGGEILSVLFSTPSTTPL